MNVQPAGIVSLSDAWLSVNDVARALRCNRNDVLRLIEENELAIIVDNNWDIVFMATAQLHPRSA